MEEGIYDESIESLNVRSDSKLYYCHLMAYVLPQVTT